MEELDVAQLKSLTPWLKKAFSQLVADQTGLKIRETEQDVLTDIILRRIKDLEFQFPEHYHQFLADNKSEAHDEWKQLILEITNTESFFFRDKGQFKLLRNHILPTLIEQKSEHKTLRICSAGCSTGEEPYSIAMLIKEMLPDLGSWELKILGVDINSKALETARNGIYRPWSFRGLNDDIRKRFFQENNGKYYIDSAIKNMVDFETVNLLRDPFSDMRINLKNIDLILCRNVFIYFSETAIKKVLDKFYDSLCPLGYLLVGHAELHGQNLKKFQINMFDESIAYQRLNDSPSHFLTETLPIQNISYLGKNTLEVSVSDNLEDLLKDKNIKMKEVALNLLRQLPTDAKIAKYGDRTAAELIRKLEQHLNQPDQT